MVHYVAKDCKADMNAKGLAGMTALMVAAMSVFEPVVSDLVKAGAAIDIADDAGNTALHYAAQGGSIACLQSLLALDAHGAPAAACKGLMAAKNVAGRTALHTACNHGQQAVVATLLKAGADASAPDKAGWTPLVRGVWGCS